MIDDFFEVYQNFSGLTKGVIDRDKVRKLFNDAVENYINGISKI